LVSENGPSITVFLPAEKRTRFPLLLGRRPSPASMMPAFTSSSLNLPMSASSFSLGITPASEFLVALTITITRIVVLLLGLEEALVGGDHRRSLSARRTSVCEIDSPGILFLRPPPTVKTSTISVGYWPGSDVNGRSGARFRCAIHQRRPRARPIPA
jgi:hypothetical protein